MCHHYRLRTDKDRLYEAFSITRTNPQLPLPLGDFYPLSQVPVVRLVDGTEREIVPMEWRLLPFWWKPSTRRQARRAFQRKCFNARCETIQEKPTFREAFKRRRCLIPATEFMERGHCLYFAKSKPFAFAGLWDRWEGESETVESCTIVTTLPNKAVQAVGHHRMPVILYEPMDVEVWLNAEHFGPENLPRLFEPRDTPSLECYRAT